MKLSEVLNTVIEDFLRENGTQFDKEEFSCIAIDRCLNYSDNCSKVHQFLKTLGLDTTGAGFVFLRNEDRYVRDEYTREEPQFDRQFTRALWLTFVIEYLKNNPEEDFEV